MAQVASGHHAPGRQGRDIVAQRTNAGFARPHEIEPRVAHHLHQVHVCRVVDLRQFLRARLSKRDPLQARLQPCCIDGPQDRLQTVRALGVVFSRIVLQEAAVVDEAKHGTLQVKVWWRETGKGVRDRYKEINPSRLRVSARTSTF